MNKSRITNAGLPPSALETFLNHRNFSEGDGVEGLPLVVSVKCFTEIFLDFDMLKYYRLPRS